jgi:hypothetical protein
VWNGRSWRSSPLGRWGRSRILEQEQGGLAYAPTSSGLTASISGGAALGVAAFFDLFNDLETPGLREAITP